MGVAHMLFANMQTHIVIYKPGSMIYFSRIKLLPHPSCTSVKDLIPWMLSQQ